MSQEYYIIFVGKNPVFFASVQKIHVAVSLHESQINFLALVQCTPLSALSKFSSDLGSMYTMLLLTVDIEPYESNLCYT